MLTFKWSALAFTALAAAVASSAAYGCANLTQAVSVVASRFLSVPQ